MRYTKIIAGLVFLVFAATFAAAQTPIVILETTTVPDRDRPGEWHEITTAEWSVIGWRFLNNYDMELWIFEPPILIVGAPSHKGRLTRWQSTPANRGAMVVEGNWRVERSELRFKLRDVVTGDVIDVEVEDGLIPR